MKLWQQFHVSFRQNLVYKYLFMIILNNIFDAKYVETCINVDTWYLPDWPVTDIYIGRLLFPPVLKQGWLSTDAGFHLDRVTDYKSNFNISQDMGKHQMYVVGCRLLVYSVSGKAVTKLALFKNSLLIVAYFGSILESGSETLIFFLLYN